MKLRQETEFGYVTNYYTTLREVFEQVQRINRTKDMFFHSRGLKDEEYSVTHYQRNL